MEEIKFALDTFYAVMAGALVMWMAAGFTMLEAGLVQKKDVSEIVTKNLGLYSIACIMYLACGFALMYPGGSYLNFLPQIASSWGLSLGTEADPILYGSDGTVGAGDFVGYYSHQADFFFQVVFVATAMSIVSGAVAGRMKLIPFFLFAIILTGFIYPIQGFWNWGGGFLSANGYSDYAGSGTVHLCGAAAALAVVMVLGPRKGKYSYDGSSIPMPGSNIPMAALGAWILWLGWFGFNGGSQLAMGSIGDVADVSRIFSNTNAAAAGGAIAALILTQLLYKKPDLTMILNGALAGLVSITAEPLAPTLGQATVIGAIGGLIVVVSVPILDKFKIDDVVGAIPVHLIAGIWGTLIVPLTNSDASFGTQLYSLIIVGIFVVITSGIVWYVLKALFGIRVDEEAEINGLDISELGMEAYPEFSKG